MKHNVQQPSPDNGQPSATIEYVYDGNGNRYSKTITHSGGTPSTRYYSYDTSGNIVSEYKRVMVNGVEKSQALVRYVRDSTGKAISMINYEDRSSNNEARTFYFIYNGHGDVTALTDQSGTVVATYSYDEFGNQTTEIGTVYNPIRYSGAHNAYYDSETGLYKMGTRYYQSDIGRWLTRDEYQGEKQEPQTQNRYVYVENNPIRKVDSTGHWGADYHHSMTYNIGKAFLGRRYATLVADGNESMDNLKNSAVSSRKNMSYHFNMNGSLNRRYKSCTRRAIYWIKKGRIEHGLDWFGKGLHSLQDKYAHPEGTLGGVLSHGTENSLYFYQKWQSYTKWIHEYQSIYDSPEKNTTGNMKAIADTKGAFRSFTRRAFGLPALVYAL